MKISKSTKYSALFFLIFLLGLIFFIASIHKTLNKKTNLFLVVDSNYQTSMVYTIEE
ncbi:membrane or secreted protein [Christiangramia forsetii KT0803]|uniref:Membrane or secreted protein n=1 Tax=Christiangramia forsetii (strain DSM 17595 / CGMCC 1.15422 / KT0803) TaxID=411154 RepID=A0M6L0_CHRFK|nr:membrane or secreted protein [Christiangramia forsetii KT0803]